MLQKRVEVVDKGQSVVAQSSTFVLDFLLQQWVPPQRGISQHVVVCFSQHCVCALVSTGHCVCALVSTVCSVCFSQHFVCALVSQWRNGYSRTSRMQDGRSSEGPQKLKNFKKMLFFKLIHNGQHQIARLHVTKIND